MAPVTPTRMVERAPRVKLGGSILALIILESKREVRTAVHQLSVNGGLLKIEKPLDEQIKVTLMFHIGATTIRTKAKMLFPMWATNGWLQPFQFIDFPEEDKQKLDSELGTLFPKPATRAGTASVLPPIVRAPETEVPPAPVMETTEEVAPEVTSDDTPVAGVAAECEASAASGIAPKDITDTQAGATEPAATTIASLAGSTDLEDTEFKDASSAEPPEPAQLPVVTDASAEAATAASAE